MKKSKTPRQPTGDYLVGNCRPPIATQFKPGQSGNPSGRRKAIPTVGEMAAKMLTEKVTVIEDGKQRRMTRQEVMLRTGFNKGMKGDWKAAEKVFALASPHVEQRETSAERAYTPFEDEQLLQAFKRDMSLGEQIERERNEDGTQPSESTSNPPEDIK